MNNNELFNLFSNGGTFTRPLLIKFSHVDLGEIYLTNNNEPIVYDEKTYEVSTFTYERPDNQGIGGTLSITSTDNQLFEFVEQADSRYRLDVVGCVLQDGTVQALKQYVHFFGSVEVDDNGNIEFSLGGDDRLDMTFTPYKYDTDNNRGNA